MNPTLNLYLQKDDIEALRTLAKEAGVVNHLHVDTPSISGLVRAIARGEAVLIGPMEPERWRTLQVALVNAQGELFGTSQPGQFAELDTLLRSIAKVPAIRQRELEGA